MDVHIEVATVLPELRRTIADILDVPVETITDTAKFVDDLGVDSLMALEIMVVLEKKDAIKIADRICRASTVSAPCARRRRRERAQA